MTRGGRGVATLLLILAMAAPDAAAQPARPDRLTGDFFLGGATLVDPPPGEARDSHAYLTISGAAAQRLYNAMRAPIRAYACEPGWRSRSEGALTCSLGPRPSDANCTFALDLQRGALAPGQPC